MFKQNIIISGIDSLESDINLLSNIERKKVTNRAVRAGAKVFRDAIKKNVPVKKGLLKKSVSVDTVRGNPFIAGVKFKKIKRKSGNGIAILSPFYWYFLEYGTSKMNAKPFIRTAFESELNKAVKAVFDCYLDEINKVFAK